MISKWLKRALVITGIAATLFISSGSAFAQSADAEKPPAVNPSRPSITNSPDLGPVGFFEVDFGMAYAKGSSSTPFLIKYAVSNNWEVRFGTAGLLSVEGDAGTDRSVGDTSFLVQWTPRRAVGEEFRWALFGGASVPTSTSAKGFSPKSWDYSAGIAMAKPFGSWRVDSNFTIAGVNRSNTKVSDRNAVLGVSCVLYRSINRWTPFAETALSFERGGPEDHKMVFGTSYAISPRFVLDGAISVGLSPNSTPYTAQFGFSILLGRVGRAAGKN